MVNLGFEADDGAFEREVVELEFNLILPSFERRGFRASDVYAPDDGILIDDDISTKVRRINTLSRVLAFLFVGVVLTFLLNEYNYQRDISSPLIYFNSSHPRLSSF